MNHAKRKHRHRRIRYKVTGTAERPRASVFRGSRQITVQLIDDTASRTIFGGATSGEGKLSKTDAARALGEKLAQEAKKQGIKAVVFDRGGYRYHGRVKAVAEGMRSAGIDC